MSDRPPEGASPHHDGSDEEFLRREAKRVRKQIVARARATKGRIDAREVRRLHHIVGLVQLGNSDPARRGPIVAITCVVVSFVAIVALSLLRLPSPIAAIEVRTASLEVKIGARRARSRNLLGASKSARISSWQNPRLPKACAAYSRVHAEEPGSMIMIQASPNAIVPQIGLGDDAVIDTAARLKYTPGADQALIFTVLSSGSAYRLPVAVAQGTLTLVSTLEAPVVCPLDGERLEFAVDELELRPSDLIGPIPAQSLSFEERILSAEAGSSTLSRVISGSITFQGIPSATVHLRHGDDVRLKPSQGEALTYLRSEQHALLVSTRGRFAELRVGEEDVRPSIIESWSNNPWLRVVAAAAGTVATLILWLLRWFGVERS
jgi:hypothetical protein